MATLTSKLIIELLDRATGPARAISGALSRINAAQVRNAAALASTQTQLLGAAAAGYALAKSISTPVKAAIDFESAMADVKKVVDFETPESFAKMGDDLLTLSKRIPIVAKDLAAISAAAGAAGMKEGEILAFTEMVAKLATAFDMTAAQAGDDMAKIKTGLGYTVEQASALADAMNYLSNNVAAKAPQLIDYMKRVGVQGKQYGFSAEQTAALGAAMIAAGAESEVAATSFRNVGRALTKGDQITKNAAAAFKQLGLTSMGVTKAMQKDAVGTFRTVLARIAKLPKHLQASVISTIFGDEARAIAPLIDNVKLLDDVLGMVADRTKYLGSAQKEFEARTATTANAVQLFKNRLNVMSVTIGSALLPALNDTMKALHPFIEKLSQFAKDHPELTRAVIGTSAALIGLRIAGIAAKWAMLWMWGGALAVARGALIALGIAAGTIGLPLTILAGLLVAVAGYAYTHWDEVLGLWQRLKSPWLDLRAEIAKTRDEMAKPWSRLPEKMGQTGNKIAGPWSGLSDKMQATLDMIIAKWSGLGPRLADTWRMMSDPMVAAISELGGKIKAGGAALYDAGVALIQSLWDGMKAKAAALLGWASSIASRIRSAFGGASAVSGAVSAAKPAVAGTRAAGGPVRAGLPYLVGERGQELFTPDESGRIINAADTARLLSARMPDLSRTSAVVEAIKAQALAVPSPVTPMLRAPVLPTPQLDGIATALDGLRESRAAAGGRAQNGRVVNHFNITNNVQAAPGQSPEAIAEAVERTLSNKLAALSRGAYSDGTN
ncbi:phage tail tape measure protein [Rhodopseudomonas parapalustris]